MRSRSTNIIIVTLLVIGLSSIFLLRSEKAPLKGMLIFSQVPVDETVMDYRRWELWPYPSQSRLVAMNPENTAEALKVLTNDFHSARAPEISYDGRRLLFAGQHQVSEPWQIWEMRLADLQARQITTCDEGCTDPAYLPDDRIVFSYLKTDLRTGTGHALYTCALDGSELRRITFHPHSNSAPTVLRDGRILLNSRQTDPTLGSAMLLVLRPDGTKAELFYKNANDDWPSSRGWETADGQVVFIESNKNYSLGGRIVSISQHRPLHSRNVLTSKIEGSFYSAFPLTSGKLIVSFRQPGVDHFALFEFDPVEKRLGQLIYGDLNYHAFEPVVVNERPKPKKLLSIVNEQKTTGWVLCLNSDFSDLPTANSTPSFTKSKKVQVSGLHEVWGEVPLEEDGSFYLEIKADTPFRFQTIDKNGLVVRGPSAWLWVRPNERRGCIGCHENRELTPENRVPLAINKPPVSLLTPLSQLSTTEIP